jgi:AbrB family looped-hinge helix DNA binding protein
MRAFVKVGKRGVVVIPANLRAIMRLKEGDLIEIEVLKVEKLE